MLSLISVLFFFQIVLMVWSAFNVVAGLAAFVADSDTAMAKEHFFFAGVTAVTSLFVGLVALSIGNITFS